MKRGLIVLLFFSLLLGGCTSFRHGYTKSDARDQFLKVNPVTENFGYKRITYIIGYRGKAIDTFVEEKGYPDYLYEFERNGREGFIFYYLAEGKAYEFVEQSWRPDSAKNIDIRKFTDFEKKRFGLK